MGKLAHEYGGVAFAALEVDSRDIGESLGPCDTEFDEAERVKTSYKLKTKS